jgi:sortase A
MRRLSLLLIIAGIVISLYPLLDRAYTWYWQNKIFSEWEKAQSLEETNRDQADDTERDTREEAGTDENEKNDSDSESMTEAIPSYEALGIMEIDKIDLKLPVLNGTSEAILRIGAGFLEGTTAIGEPGNTVLTAHRSHTYGRFFNRLDELEVGDKITITTTDELFNYTVYKTTLVKVKDTSVLESDGGESILTLYTCDPLYSVNPPNRLIVQAKLHE